MPDIFVSYRQADSRYGAAATYELLARRFGRERVFLDNQSIHPGAIYPSTIRRALESMRTMLVLIGPEWSTPDTRRPGRPPIWHDSDWVRREIHRAIERDVPIIPVLLDGADLPTPDSLPDDIRALTLRQFVEVRHRYFGIDTRRLADWLAELLPDLTTPGDPADGATPRQLPWDCGWLVGRDEQLTRLDATLCRPGASTPAITVLTGMAGVGKTALAVHWGHRVATEFPDGQLFVDLGGHGADRPPTPLEVLAWFLRALGIGRPEAMTSLDERSAHWRTLASGRRLLIVLDNAESARQIRPLLPGTGRVAVVVTSRNRLDALTVEHAADTIAVRPLSDMDGVELLRATVDSRVDADPDAAKSLVARCAGLPLALRIAAELVLSRPFVPLRGLVTELNDERARFDVLNTGDPQYDLRAVFSRSYRSLRFRHALTFRLLSLHPGRAFDLAAAAALLCVDASVAAGSLAALTGAHLLVELKAGRFEMHDLLRTYAREIVTSADDPSGSLRRLFDHYLHTAERADRLIAPHRHRLPIDGDMSAGLSVDDAAQAQHWLENEQSNLVALCRLDVPDLDSRRWQLAYVLRGYFYVSKQFDDWIETHMNALAASVRARNTRAEAVTRNNLGMALVERGLLDQAMDHFTTAERLFVSVGDDHGIGNALANEASVLRRRGDYEQALRNLRRALAIYARNGPRRNRGITLRSMSGVELEVGRIGRAVRFARQALDIARELELELDAAQACNALASALHQAGDFIAAETASHQAVALAVRCSSHYEHAGAARRLGALAAATNRDGDAERWYRMALTLYRRLGSGTVADSVAADLAALAEGGDSPRGGLFDPPIRP